MTFRSFYSEWISPQRWLDRAGVRPPMRIAIGLVLLTSCVLLLAEALQLIPSNDQAELHARSLLAELASSHVAFAAARNDSSDIGKFFDQLIQRNDDVLSIGLRSVNKTILVETSGHEKQWLGATPNVNTPTHIRVPMFYGKHYWAQLELSFKPLTGSTLTAWWSTPTARMATFILAASFLFYWFFLSRMLRVLDPSSAVPDRIQLLIDTLVEGIAILDNNDQIVMVNESFAHTTFLPVDRLLGRSLSSLPWQTKDNPNAPAVHPWHSVQQSDLPARGVNMRLQIGTHQGRQLNVNASPIFDSAGARCGVIVTFDDQTVVESDNLQLAQFIEQFGNTSGEIHKLREQLVSDGNNDYLERLEHLAETARDIVHASTHNIQDTITTTPETRDKMGNIDSSPILNNYRNLDFAKRSLNSRNSACDDTNRVLEDQTKSSS